MPPLALTALLSCSSGSLPVDDIPLALTLDTPAYGAFAGADAIAVRGRVAPPGAVVTVENRRVNVGSDGSFSVEVPIAGPVRNLDIRAFWREDAVRERVPVFAGDDPRDAFPGGLGLRLTPRLLNDLAEQIELGLVEADWATGLVDALPSLSTDALTIAPTRLRHRAPEVTLTPDAQGIAFELLYRDVVLELDAGFQLGDTWTDFPSEVGFEDLRITARLAVGTRPDGTLVLSLTNADVALADPILQLGPIDGALLGFAVQFLGDLVAGLGDLLLGLVTGALTEIPLGGPLAFEADLLGTPLAVSLDGLGTDPEGIWIDLGVGLGGPVPDPLVVHRPTLAQGGPRADLIAAVHEGLFAPLAQSELLDLVSQDLELSGVLGLGVGLVFTSLPGGWAAPEADGWCVRVSPGDARLVRMGGDPNTLATLYLPDLRLNVGVTHAGLRCDPWLEASLAARARFALDGSAVGVELDAPDGAVLFYAAPGEHDEAEIVAGLARLFDLLTTFGGGALSFDLADLLGGGVGLDGVSPRVLGVLPIDGPDGEPVPGLFALPVELL